jgi:Nodulation protein Z (NodZ).
LKNNILYLWVCAGDYAILNVKKHMKNKLVWLLFLSSSLFGKNYYHLKSLDQDGFFVTCLKLLGSLRLYEERPEAVAGLTIDFGKEGRYYDPLYGANWWEYYFYPLSLGSAIGATCIKTDEIQSGVPGFIVKHTSRTECLALLDTYFKIRPEIVSAVASFKASFFKGFTIGVHYRGTDKHTLKGKYREVANAIERLVKKKQLHTFTLFVATDDAAFLTFIAKRFPREITYVKEALRSTDSSPIHFSGIEPYKRGREALIDCLLLSQCDFLIRTDSNLSLFATYFNPELPVTLLH